MKPMKGCKIKKSWLRSTRVAENRTTQAILELYDPLWRHQWVSGSSYMTHSTQNLISFWMICVKVCFATNGLNHFLLPGWFKVELKADQIYRSASSQKLFSCQQAWFGLKIYVYSSSWPISNRFIMLTRSRGHRGPALDKPPTYIDYRLQV